jgi:hypothetical protein
LAGNKKMPALPPENAGIISDCIEATFLFSPPPFRQSETQFEKCCFEQESMCFMHEQGQPRELLISTSSAQGSRKKFQNPENSYGIQRWRCFTAS